MSKALNWFNGPSEESSRTVLRLFWALLAIGSCALLYFQHLAFLDTPNHLTRYYLLTRDYNTPFYNQFFLDNFKLIPNIGVDAIMFVLGRIVDASLAIRLVFVFCFLSFSIGFAQINKVRNDGGFSPTILLLPIIALSYSVFLGFLNFSLGLSLLPWAILVFETKKESIGKWAVIALWTIILFFSHLLTAVLFVYITGLLILFRSKGTERRGMFLKLFSQLVLILILYKLSSTSASNEHGTIVFSTVSEKIKYLLAFLVYGPWWKITTVAFFASFFIAFVFGKSSIKKEDLVVVAGIVLFYLACPFGFKITANMDGRLPTLIFALAVAFATANNKSRTYQSLMVPSFVLATLAHFICVFDAVRVSHNEVLVMRRILKQVPSGSVLLPYSLNHTGNNRRDEWYPAFFMTPFFTSIDRPVVIIGTFAFASQQPIVFRKEIMKTGFSAPMPKSGESLTDQVKPLNNWKENKAIAFRSVGINKIYVLLINHKRTGFEGIDYPNVISQDQTYCLLTLPLGM